jgi:hypothetical protein
MINAGRMLALTLVVLLAAACATKQPGDGYRPPATRDGLAALAQNWDRVSLYWGFRGVTFEYSDGESVSLDAEIFVQPLLRSRYDLISSRGNEAVVTVTPDFINLLNHRERYFLRETTTPENAEQLVGLFLPAQELAAILSGRGFDPARFAQVYADPDDTGGSFLRLFHASEPIVASGWIDPYGRLRSIIYRESDSDAPIVRVSYDDFHRDSDSGLVWPGHVVIELMRRGERITLDGGRISINDPAMMQNLDSRIFARLERGQRVYLQDVPPGPPLLYRSVKEYVRPADSVQRP